MNPYSYEKAIHQWVEYQRLEFKNDINPLTLEAIWEDRKEVFRRAVGYTLRNGNKELTLDPQDELKALRDQLAELRKENRKLRERLAA